MISYLSPEDRTYFAQQMIMPEVGEHGQQQLKNARVLIVGVGGLGTPVAQYLARAGVGTLGLVEHDVVEASNLHRQIFYSEKNIGEEKILIAEKIVQEIYPGINVELHKAFLDEKNAVDIVKHYDIVADCTDNFSSRYLINDACFFAGKPLVFASVFRFNGQLTLFHAGAGPCYRCLYPEAPPDVQNCSTAGVIGSVAGTMGTLAATEVIKNILRVGQSLRGRLLSFDALAMRWREFEIKKNPECMLCGSLPQIHSVETNFSSSCSTIFMSTTTDITVEELKRRFDAGEKLFLLDVREPKEYAICNLGGKLVPLSTLPGHIDELDPKEEIIVHCKMGGRSAQAAQYLRANGFKHVRNLAGGIIAWAEKIDPSMKKY